MKTITIKTLDFCLSIAAVTCLASVSFAQPNAPANGQPGLTPGRAPAVRDITKSDAAGGYKVLGWEVDPGTEIVRDFHVCWPSDDAQVKQAKKDLEGQADKKGVAPSGWWAYVKDDVKIDQQKFLCIQFFRRSDVGRALTKPANRGDLLPDNQFKIEVSSYLGERAVKFVTTSIPGQEPGWAHPGRKDIKYRSDDKKPTPPAPVPPDPPTANEDDTVINGDTVFTYVVDPKQAGTVKDVHFCMPGGPDDDTKYAKYLEDLKSKIAVSTTSADYPKNWEHSIHRDDNTSRWCVDFFAGKNGAPLKKNTNSFFNFTIKPDMAKVGKGVMVLYTTNGEESFDDGALYFTDDTNKTGPWLTSLPQKDRPSETNDPAAASGAMAVSLVRTGDAPAIRSAPAFAATGRNIAILGSGFSRVPEGNKVFLGGRELPVLASSTTELTVAAPTEGPLGTQELTVTTELGVSRPVQVTLLGIRMESRSTALHSGQKGEAQLLVDGTTKSVTLMVANLTPQTIAMKGGSTVEVRTSGGTNNHARIEYRAGSPGTFTIMADVAAAGK